ncbi:MAG TPA: ABC transporter permease [Pseudonocardiaceae bacterium]|nr:ABC transporter permease [Pseudonocardiaceae bacterium]
MSTPAEARPKRDWTAYAPLDAGPLRQVRAASADLAEGVRRHRAWRYLAFEQVKNSYRRTVFGPWWLTAQMTVYVIGLAFIFSQLLGSKINTFLPYVAVGFLGYTLLLGIVRDGANVFVGQAGVIKSTRQPLSSLVLRSVMVELLQFGHNAVIVLPFFAFGLITPSVWLLLAPLSLAVILLNGVLIALWLGPTVARFRDVAPGIDSILQVIIFFTPVFYQQSALHGVQAALIGWNPFTYFIDLLRDPVLGHHPTVGTAIGAAAFTLANFVLALVLYSRSRSRLPYWVS